MDKKSTYHTNGSGRDMYIFSTNGGFLKNKPQTFNFDPSSTKKN